MVAILIVGFAALTWGAVWLKRRHHRKYEERRATLSGFPAADEKRGPRAATPDLWGPHQHMHHTNGFEYSDPIVGSGALAATANRDDARRSKRLSSMQRRNGDGNEMAELGAKQSASRRQSATKGGATARGEAVQADSDIMPADRSRSRSQRGGDSDGDFERQSDREHQRRLREVRGVHRKKVNDQSH